MKIGDLTKHLQQIAPPGLQESYDNAGLLTGNEEWDCSGALISLDVTEAVLDEALANHCNLVIAHHPFIFKGLKKITGSGWVERTLIKAIKNDLAIYAIHTNLDNIIEGVSGKMASMLGLKNVRVLSEKSGNLKKLYTYVPTKHLATVRDALFKAGAGHIGNYSECSFGSEGTGTFKAGEGTNPFVGEPGKLHEEKEIKLEIIFPDWVENGVLQALRDSHPYEEVAFEVISLDNRHGGVGSGAIGEMEKEMSETEFLSLLRESFRVPIIRHTPLNGRRIRKVSLCGGAGSFLIAKALAKGSDAYISADIKYHDFFEADGRMLIADIGHYESEQFTIDLLKDKLEKKFPNFAVLKTAVNTNPVGYFWQ